MSPDQDVIAAVIAGDAEAAQTFHERYVPWIRGLAVGRYRYPPDRADDVVQAVVLKLWQDDFRALRAWRGEGRFSTYLTVIVTRHCLERMRTAGREQSLDGTAAQAGSSTASSKGSSGEEGYVLEPAAPEPSAHHQLAQRQQREIVRSSLRELSARDRLLIVLRYHDDLPVQEIARTLGLRPATARKALHDARRRLKQRLESQHPELFDPAAPHRSSESESVSGSTEETGQEVGGNVSGPQPSHRVKEL